MIRIIDCGSQLTQNIARRIREFNVYSEILPYSTPVDEVLCDGLEGLIISGGQFSIHDRGAPIYDEAILEAGVPVLGICYGQQSIAHLLGGRVQSTSDREYGKTRIHLSGHSPLFEDISFQALDVWMSHADIVTYIPDGFEVIARSVNGHIAAMQDLNKNIYSVQFHPEVDHTQYGRQILDNYLSICNARRDWTAESFIDTTIKRIQDTVGGGVAIAGVSGGIDSTTLAVLMQRALGDRFCGIVVDNGLLRKDEGVEIRKSLDALGVNYAFVDASQRFINMLKGVTDPDEKRKRIGHKFIKVFEEEARKHKKVKYLGQGTLYPDVIESVPLYGVSSTIKRHHNVGGLPEKMALDLIEPFRDMFKDEVRAVAEKLGMPREIVWRHPFPGPGLAVRIIGEVTPEKLSLLRDADEIFMQELKSRDLYYDIGQAFVVLSSGMSVGVMGDGGTYQNVAALRAVTTKDFMTSDIFRFEWDDLQEMTNRIINEVKGINRVVYDTTQKPPGTIEWE